MTSSPNAQPFNISLYPKHIEKIQKHRTRNKLKSDAASLQDIIDKYFKQKDTGIKKDAIILVVYPIILCIFSLYGANSITKIMDKLIAKNYTHIGELATLETIYSSLGFITLGILAMCMIFFINQVKVKYGD